MKIKTLVIDDEKNVRSFISSLLQKYFHSSIEIAGEADDVESGLKLINQTQPDLVFLDIKMKTGTGFDLLKKVKNKSFEVVFITAYNQYAIEAFQFSALGYLLKPIKVSDLKQEIEKVSSYLNLKNEKEDKRLKVLIENYGADDEIKKIVINKMDGFKVAHLKNIIRLEGDRNYTHFILDNGDKLTTSKTLGEYEELLNEYGFFRIHQSTIVNLHHVESYLKGDGGEVTMTDQKTFKVSRNRKASFLNRFH